MAGYLNQNGNSIGSLLRFIQEQKSASPINPQSSEVGSPLRSVIQEPLSGSEGKGTSKVVSVRPEGTLTPSGQPIEQGTPQSSRIGPISIGGQGDVTQTPTNVVAANEPGPGMGIPSATKTVGDVMNKTGSASLPSIGTSIKPKGPTTLSGAPVAESVRGQEVVNYNYARDKANADKTAEDIKLGVEAGERSIPETQAKLDELIARQDALQGELTAEDQALLNRPLSDRALAEARSQRDRFLAARGAMNVTPTPTPSPMQGGSGGGSSSGGSSNSSGGGQVKGATTVRQSIAPKIQMSSATNSQAANYRPSSATQSIAPKQTQSKPAPAKSSPSIGTIIGGGALQAIKKLFGR